MRFYGDEVSGNTVVGRWAIGLLVVAVRRQVILVRLLGTMECRLPCQDLLCAERSH